MTRRTAVDNRFFNALKLGDKDYPRIRANAAGQLATMARTRRKDRQLMAELLLTNLLLEPDPGVVPIIGEALAKIDH